MKTKKGVCQIKTWELQCEGRTFEKNMVNICYVRVRNLKLFLNCRLFCFENIHSILFSGCSGNNVYQCSYNDTTTFFNYRTFNAKASKQECSGSNVKSKTNFLGHCRSINLLENQNADLLNVLPSHSTVGGEELLGPPEQIMSVMKPSSANWFILSQM